MGKAMKDRSLRFVLLVLFSAHGPPRDGQASKSSRRSKQRTAKQPRSGEDQATSGPPSRRR